MRSDGNGAGERAGSHDKAAEIHVLFFTTLSVGCDGDFTRLVVLLAKEDIV